MLHELTRVEHRNVQRDVELRRLVELADAAIQFGRKRPGGDLDCGQARRLRREVRRDAAGQSQTQGTGRHRLTGKIRGEIQVVH